MTSFERAAIAAAAAVAIAAPAVSLGFGAEPIAREMPPPPLLLPRAAPAVSAIYRRDLFGGAGGAGAAVVGDDAVAGDAPDLVGIVGRIGHDAVALVRVGGATRTVSVGEAVDGWTLESLAIDAAYFTRGGQQQRVPLPAGN